MLRPPGSSGSGRRASTALAFLSAKLAADVPIVSPSCGGTVNGETTRTSTRLSSNKELIAGKPICPSIPSGRQAGPLYVQNPNGDWLLAGATSRGTDISSTMWATVGTYVRVDAYAEWIKSVLDESKPAALASQRKTKPKAGPKRSQSKPKAKAKTGSSPSRRPRSRRNAKAVEVSSRGSLSAASAGEVSTDPAGPPSRYAATAR